MQTPHPDRLAAGPDRSIDDLERLIAGLHKGLGLQRGALLPLLHALQEELGHVPASAVPHLAQVLNLSRAEVHGVISFYHDFRAEPAGTHTVKICRAEACQARGGRSIEAAAAERLGVRMGETRADGHVTLEPVYCLGLCATGPNAMVDGRPVSRLDACKLERLAEEIGA